MKTPSVEPVLRSRLLPRMSFRFFFAMMTCGAVIAALSRAAGEGGPLAIATIVTLGFLAAAFGLFVLFFIISYMVGALWYQPQEEQIQGSPFAADQLPPQILPPRDQKS